jgi:hypothetical protein
MKDKNKKQIMLREEHEQEGESKRKSREGEYG